ncbi:MAG: hypothetical protein BWY72_02442 [Bacteroidetes bacterium ADurb.Bin416]|nr:MAG: hypothetical protein BWY72_02442 [Bacteroidetes bacterium ADurb.Bin416]
MPEYIDIGRIVPVEIDGGYRIEFPQRFPDGGVYNGPDRLFVFELYFRFGGMNVDIQGFGIHLEVEEIGWLHTSGQQCFIGLEDSIPEVLVANESTIDEKVL